MNQAVANRQGQINISDVFFFKACDESYLFTCEV